MHFWPPVQIIPNRRGAASRPAGTKKARDGHRRSGPFARRASGSAKGEVVEQRAAAVGIADAGRAADVDGKAAAGDGQHRRPGGQEDGVVPQGQAPVIVAAVLAGAGIAEQQHRRGREAQFDDPRRLSVPGVGPGHGFRLAEHLRVDLGEVRVKLLPQKTVLRLPLGEPVMRGLSACHEASLLTPRAPGSRVGRTGTL